MYACILGYVYKSDWGQRAEVVRSRKWARTHRTFFGRGCAPGPFARAVSGGRCVVYFPPPPPRIHYTTSRSLDASPERTVKVLKGPRPALG
jgi:hypothetical protein